MQHVGLHHPEISNAPLTSEKGKKEQHAPTISESIRKAGMHDEGSPTLSEYIECECGETIALADFEDHRDLHLAEDTGAEDPDAFFDDAQTNISRAAIPSSEAEVTSRAWVKDVSNPQVGRLYSSEMGPVRKSRHDCSTSHGVSSLKALDALSISNENRLVAHPGREPSQQGKSSKQHSSKKSRIDAFLITNALQRRASPRAGKPKQAGLQRLGVCAAYKFIGDLADDGFREKSSDPSPSRNTCHRGWRRS